MILQPSLSKLRPIFSFIMDSATKPSEENEAMDQEETEEQQTFPKRFRTPEEVIDFWWQQLKNVR